MNYQVLKMAGLFLVLTSCIIKSPKYTSLEQVMNLRTGMTKTEVEHVLGIEPYDLKSYNDSSNIFIYVYRVNDRRTLSFNTKPVNGRKAQGKYKPLAVTYSKEAKLVSVESCSLCEDNLTSMSKLDFAKILMFLTVTVPVILIYLGLKSK